MQLNISGHHVELTPALKDYVSEKFEKLERHFDHNYDRPFHPI